MQIGVYKSLHVPMIVVLYFQLELWSSKAESQILT